MTSVLITGVNGFIGARLARRLKARGWAVTGADIQAGGPPEACDRYVQIDLGAPDAGARLGALDAADRIVHCGGVSGFMVERDNPRRIFDVNVSGTMEVLEFARTRGCGRIVLCSTLMVYGPHQSGEGDLVESDYPAPISVYGASKVALEGLMCGYAGQYGIDAIALRFSHVFGPGRTTECFIRDMLRAAAERRPCRIGQAATSLRQYVHVDDVCDSIERALDVAAPQPRVFNISADEMHTLAEAARIVRSVVGPLDVSFDDANDLPNYRIRKLSIAAARAELGYRPKYDLAGGIRRYWESSFLRTGAAPSAGAAGAPA